MKIHPCRAKFRSGRNRLAETVSLRGPGSQKLRPSFGSDSRFIDAARRRAETARGKWKGTASVTQTRDSVLLDVIGLRGSHVNPRLVARPAPWLMCQSRAGRIKSPTPTRRPADPPTRRPSEFSDGPLIGSLFGVAWASWNISLAAELGRSGGGHRLTLEEFHEAFGETKSATARDQQGGRRSFVRCVSRDARAHAWLRAYAWAYLARISQALADRMFGLDRHRASNAYKTLGATPRKDSTDLLLDSISVANSISLSRAMRESASVPLDFASG